MLHGFLQVAADVEAAERPPPFLADTVHATDARASPRLALSCCSADVELADDQKERKVLIKRLGDLPS
jgi:hypothetical protein